MKKRYIVICLFLFFSAHAFHKNLFFDIINNSPKWVKDQINHDFNFFYENKINDQKISQTFLKLKIFQESLNDYTIFARVKIVNGEIFILLSDCKKNIPNSIKNVCKSLNYINNELINLPNIDFIICSYDGYPENNKIFQFFPKGLHYMNDYLLQAPIFTWATVKNVNYIILIPDFFTLDGLEAPYHEMLRTNSMTEFQWDKKIESAFWRGNNSDKEYTIDTYLLKPRYKICMFSKDYPNLINAQFSSINFGDDKLKKILTNNTLNIISINNCENELHYKYLLVLDSFMSSFYEYILKLLSRSVCLKQKSDEIQWFYAALKPYIHYIPIEYDMSDLIEKIHWAKNNDDLCKEISENATNFVIENLKIEDIYAYFYLVIKEYANVQETSNIQINMKEGWQKFSEETKFYHN